MAVSGLEMAQNSARLSWSKEEVDDKLKSIMKSIFNASKEVRPKDLVYTSWVAVCDKASRAWTSRLRADPTSASASLGYSVGMQSVLMFETGPFLDRALLMLHLQVCLVKLTRPDICRLKPPY